MIKTEYYMTRKDGVTLNRTYSDKGMMIRAADGTLYSEAIDPAEMNRQYTETNQPIDAPPPTDAERLAALENQLAGIVSAYREGVNNA